MEGNSPVLIWNCNIKLPGESRESNMYMNQRDAQTSCDYTYFPLDALHVSDCISPSSGATL